MDVIAQTIVVEGRDDRSAVERAVNAPILETHGFGIRAEKWKELEAAYARTGLIIFTDPDFSGEKIRARLAERFPDALHAYLTAAEAEREGDIGIENASPEAIAAALQKAHAVVRRNVSGNRSVDAGKQNTTGTAWAYRTEENQKPGSIAGILKAEEPPNPVTAAVSLKEEAACDLTPEFTVADMIPFSGGEGAAQRRRALGSILGIGYSNAAMMLKKLNRMGITREEFDAACRAVLK